MREATETGHFLRNGGEAGGLEISCWGHVGGGGERRSAGGSCSLPEK